MKQFVPYPGNLANEMADPEDLDDEDGPAMPLGDFDPEIEQGALSDTEPVGTYDSDIDLEAFRRNRCKGSS